MLAHEQTSAKSTYKITWIVSPPIVLATTHAITAMFNPPPSSKGGGGELLGEDRSPSGGGGGVDGEGGCGGIGKRCVCVEVEPLGADLFHTPPQKILVKAAGTPENPPRPVTLLVSHLPMSGWKETLLWKKTSFAQYYSWGSSVSDIISQAVKRSGCCWHIGTFAPCS
eukprot:scaffold656_cov403-Pavlova_lutheri.AAC.6